VVDMGEDAEAELGILVENLALRHVVAHVLGDERLVLEDLLDDLADLLASGRSRPFRERALAGGAELLASPAHDVTSWVCRLFSPRGGAVRGAPRGACRRAARPRR